MSSRTLRAFSRRVPYRAHDRARVLLVEHEELADDGRGHLGVALGEPLVEVEDREQVEPRTRRLFGGRLEEAVVGDVEHAGGVLRPLHVPPHPEQRLRVSGEHQSPSPASTQVSFEPPPWEEFTTSDPLRNATRVSPPGITSMRSPESTNGRRST